MKAANTEKIAALFIEQQDKELIESRSDAFDYMDVEGRATHGAIAENTLDTLTIH